MKKVLGLAIVFILGAALGFIIAITHSNRLPAKVAPDAVEEPKKPAKPNGRIEELERQLAESRAEIARLKEEAKDAAKVDVATDTTTMSFPTNIDFNAEMRKNMTDEQYTAVTNAISGFRSRLAARAKGRIDFLSSVDVSKMSAEDRENHEKFLSLMKEREELMSKMKTGSFPDMGTMQKMMEIGMQMAPAAKKERSMLVNEVTRELGYEGDDAAVVSDTINSIYDCTSNGGMGSIEDAMEALGGDNGGVDMKIVPMQ